MTYKVMARGVACRPQPDTRPITFSITPPDSWRGDPMEAVQVVCNPDGLEWVSREDAELQAERLRGGGWKDVTIREVQS